MPPLAPVLVTGATAFIDVRDVAEVAAQAFVHPDRHRDRAWTPTGARALSYAEVATIVSGVLDRPIRHRGRLGRADALTDDVLTVTGHDPTSFEDFAAREAHRWTPSH